MPIKQYIVNMMLKKWRERDNAILAAQPLPDGVEARIDIPYIEDGHRGHLLDVYYPVDAEQKLPVIIDIHGGGFLYGDKDLNKLYGYHLAKKGFIVFNLNYRLVSDDTRVPGQIWDVVSAIHWIGENLDAFPADKESIHITGESAGGVLALMATLISKSERLRELFGTRPIKSDIKSIAVICGMLRVDDPAIGYWGMRSMCFDKGYKKQGCYQNMIFENLPEIKELPPVFLATSDEDELRGMTFDFERTLKKHGVAYELKCFEKGRGRKLGHIFSVLHPGYDESAELIDKMLAFFVKSARAL